MLFVKPTLFNSLNSSPSQFHALPYPLLNLLSLFGTACICRHLGSSIVVWVVSQKLHPGRKLDSPSPSNRQLRLLGPSYRGGTLSVPSQSMLEFWLCAQPLMPEPSLQSPCWNFAWLDLQEIFLDSITSTEFMCAAALLCQCRCPLLLALTSFLPLFHDDPWTLQAGSVILTPHLELDMPHSSIPHIVTIVALYFN